ncbi:MAG: glycosyltransferase [bacterium]|nr:glycosyltransferase [bacterium]
MSKTQISIVVPTLNEATTIATLITRIDNSLPSEQFDYEIIFVDDVSDDKTPQLIAELSQRFPITFISKGSIKNRGKASSLIKGFAAAKYPFVAMIDADLQYPPEAIPKMITMLTLGADIVVANRKEQKTNVIRRFLHGGFKYFFTYLLHGFSLDVQSGLKVFKKNVLEHIEVDPSPWTFDLEFLIHARAAGYEIETVDIVFEERKSGQTKVKLLQTTYEIGSNAFKLKLKGNPIIPFSPQMIEEHGQGHHYKGVRFVHHSGLHHSESAIEVMSFNQKFILVTGGAIAIAALIVNWHTAIIIIIAILTILYFIDLLFNFFLIYRSFSKPSDIIITQEQIKERDLREYPTYTIFCPLYQEWEVLPQFVNAMSRLEYPKDKLQVMLLLEENDPQTIAKAREFNLPDFFQIVIVPHSLPKTKPKACNYGLKFATGEYVVIYDAEDVPDVEQLKKAVIAFDKSPDNIRCIQAKLNYYNPHQNLLTKLFTAEYSLWFDLVLTGLHSIKALIPLGGTSNHFKVADLRELKGWDAFNVTEDCDLGIRLAKKGYRTAVIDSITLEEANSSFPNWIMQRSRWIKGYIQSYFVHMRHPSLFFKSKAHIHLIALQTIVGGKILSMFINPIMWSITIIYFVFRPYVGTFIESLFPTPVFYMALFCLIIGNFLYMYYYMIGCSKREHDDIMKYAILVPFYWLAMSVAAWVALYKLATAPHQWSKTKHGLHLNNKKAMKQASERIGRNLVDEPAHSTVS